MLYKEVIDKMNEIFEQENTLYKGACSTSSFGKDINIWEIQKEFNNFNNIKGIKVSPKLYFYLENLTEIIFKKLNIIDEKACQKNIQTLYGYPIAIDINLNDYEYKIMGKEND